MKNNILSIFSKPCWKTILVAMSLLIATTGNLQASDSNALISLKSGTHFAIMRHALAPGTGDPSNFNVNDCSTQRNLSQQGIKQSVAIGQQLKEIGINNAQLFTSQWCRCIDTAHYLGLNKAVELPVINSFYQNQSRGPAQTESLRTWLATQDLSKPMILVTHQVNITALTGVYPASGEIIIIKKENNGSLTVTDRVQIN